MRLREKIKTSGVNSAWEENYQICEELKRVYKTASRDLKLSKLKELVFVRITKARHSSDEYQKRRNKKHPIIKPCWVCRDRAFFQHHIVMLKNGGFDSGINRIPICGDCHKKIHPWLSNPQEKRV